MLQAGGMRSSRYAKPLIFEQAEFGKIAIRFT